MPVHKWKLKFYLRVVCIDVICIGFMALQQFSSFLFSVCHSIFSSAHRRSIGINVYLSNTKRDENAFSTQIEFKTYFRHLYGRHLFPVWHENSTNVEYFNAASILPQARKFKANLYIVYVMNVNNMRLYVSSKSGSYCI